MCHVCVIMFRFLWPLWVALHHETFFSIIPNVIPLRNAFQIGLHAGTGRYSLQQLIFTHEVRVDPDKIPTSSAYTLEIYKKPLNYY